MHIQHTTADIKNMFSRPMPLGTCYEVCFLSDGLHKRPHNASSQPDFFATSGQVFGYESCLSDSSYSAARKLGNHNTMFADTHVSLTIKEHSQACWQLCVINATRTKTAHVIWWIRSIVQGSSRWQVNTNGNANVRTWALPCASISCHCY